MRDVLRSVCAIISFSHSHSRRINDLRSRRMRHASSSLTCAPAPNDSVCDIVLTRRKRSSKV